MPGVCAPGIIFMSDFSLPYILNLKVDVTGGRSLFMKEMWIDGWFGLTDCPILKSTFHGIAEKREGRAAT